MKAPLLSIRSWNSLELSENPRYLRIPDSYPPFYILGGVALVKLDDLPKSPETEIKSVVLFPSSTLFLPHSVPFTLKLLGYFYSFTVLDILLVFRPVCLYSKSFLTHLLNSTRKPSHSLGCYHGAGEHAAGLAFTSEWNCGWRKRGLRVFRNVHFLIKLIIIDEKKLNLEKHLSCFRLQILKALGSGAGGGCLWCSVSHLSFLCW